MTKKTRKRRVAAFVGALAVLAPVVFFLGCAGWRTAISANFRTPKWLGRTVKTDVVDELECYAVVKRYAPILKQRVYSDTKLNFPLNLAFDGDRDSSNNHQSLYDPESESKLEATVYYSVVESETHWFLTFLIYHARDRWEHGLIQLTHYLRLGGSHENDGENVQLVIRKASEKGPETLELIACQHHNATDFFVLDKTFWEDHSTFGAKQLEGVRPVFHLEPGKHGIYLKDFPDFDGATTLTFRPDPTNAGDAWSADMTDFHYALVPIRTALWEPYLDGESLGNEGIMDGAFDVDLSRDDDGTGAVYKGIPRFFNSDEWSVLFLKNDAGIMPFYFGRGKLFFDPAWHYRKRFRPKEPWSVTYLYNPYFDGASLKREGGDPTSRLKVREK